MLIIASIFLLAALIFVPLFKRAGLGTVLGYLVAGSLIGPFGMRWINEVESTLHLAELGVVFLLFIIGLELEPRRLWAMRGPLLGRGGLQVVITAAVVAFIQFFMLTSEPQLTKSLLIGFTLSLSSTAFVLQTLIERGQLKTDFGQASFSILLLQDLAAIPILVLIPYLGTQTSNNSTSNLWLIPVLFILTLPIMARFIYRPILRGIAQMKSREMLTIATLFIVIGAALIMNSAGVSMGLGAFLAGVIFAESEFRHELEADLEPFKGLLMGLFFMAVGMTVDWKFFYQEVTLITGLTLSFIAIKFSVLLLLGRLTRLSWPSSLRLAAFLAQGGEFAFVIFSPALNSSILNAEEVKVLSIMVTLSMMATPLIVGLTEKLLARYFEACQAERKIEIPEHDSHVIIAGLGRFGQIFARLLRAQGITFTGIDHDTEQIALLERFGIKVYFGDCSRLEILQAAQVEKAKFFIIAIDDVEASLRTAQLLKEHFPHLKVFARARNRQHVFDLKDEGVFAIKRETLDSSVDLAKQLLVAYGLPQQRVEMIASKFKHHDELMLEEQYLVRHDQDSFTSVSKQGAEQLQQILTEESEVSYIAPVNPPSSNL